VEEHASVVKAARRRVAKHQSLMDDLNNASVHDFDKTYAKQQVDGHEEAKDCSSSMRRAATMLT
jgi:hypothetical protein